MPMSIVVPMSQGQHSNNRNPPNCHFHSYCPTDNCAAVYWRSHHRQSPWRSSLLPHAITAARSAVVDSPEGRAVLEDGIQGPLLEHGQHPMWQRAQLNEFVLG